MKKQIIFLFICKIGIGQNLNITYLNIGTKENNLMVEQALNNYDYYFIGENHDSKGLSESKSKLINILTRKNIKNIYVEESILYKHEYYLVFNVFNEDTTNSIFSEIASSNEYSRFLKRLYAFNKNDSLKNKFIVKPIDFFEGDELKVKQILNYYSNRRKPIIIKHDLNELKQINKKTLPKQRIDLYVKFYNNFKENQKTHISYLGQTKFNELNLVLKGLEFYNESVKEKGELYYQSAKREDFMFENIADDINHNDSLKFISFNGHFHIPLNVPSEWVGVQNWESLAYKVKKAYPNKKVCSIYFMNRKDDSLSDQYFPQEKKLILDNTKEGETYLIRLDGEDSPFKELSKKFQYIVVW